MKKKRKLKRNIKLTLLRFTITLCLFLIFLNYGISTYRKNELAKINYDIAKEFKYNIDITMLVNYEHKVPDNYDLKLKDIENNKVAIILYNSLRRMMATANDDGIEIVINNSYRSNSDQKRIYDSKIKSYQNQGYNYITAEKLTKSSVAEPGYSEHETGLAIDFSKSGNYTKNNKMWSWLNKNAYKFGFILRYPENKTNITKVEYEPWHYRYVGNELAKEIYESNLTLEEYYQNKK